MLCALCALFPAARVNSFSNLHVGSCGMLGSRRRGLRRGLEGLAAAEGTVLASQSHRLLQVFNLHCATRCTTELIAFVLFARSILLLRTQLVGKGRSRGSAV